MDGAERIFEVLAASGIEYLVVGGLAVNAHGYVRLTMDIDLVIRLQPSNITKALVTLAEAGFQPSVPITPAQFADPANREQWRHDKDMRVLKLWNDKYPLTPVDIFVYEPFDFEAEYARALWVTVRPGLEAPVVALSALLAMKREAARPQDIADIEALNKLNQHDESH